MKEKKTYSAPTADVAEVNLPCSILSVSGQVESGKWSGLGDDETQNGGVKGGEWSDPFDQ